MKSFSHVVALAAALVLGFGLKASDPVGVYAMIHRVDFEPREGPPERVRISGTFALATGDLPPYGSISDVCVVTGGFYSAPVRGYLYYSLTPGSEEVSRIEWADLSRLAGTGQCVAFGTRDQPVARVRSNRERPQDPDVYPLNMGLIRISDDTQNPPPRNLLSMPTPVSPEDGSSVQFGRVTLVVRNLLSPEKATARYAFEIQDSSGEKERSPLIPAGDTGTQWSPEMVVKADQEYTWLAWATDGEWTGPEATATFLPYFRRGDANADLEVDLSDAVWVLEHLFLGGSRPKPLEAGDVNDSGLLDLSDAIYLLTFLFLAGPPPPPPFPGPGPKPAF